MKEIQLHRIDLNLLVVFEALMQEGSVAGAAAKLNKTPSAVSHALARLRDQVGDPLMVKVGGRMQASPFALQLIDDVRPILNSIKRVLKLPEPFDPAVSRRTARWRPDFPPRPEGRGDRPADKLPFVILACTSHHVASESAREACQSEARAV